MTPEQLNQAIERTHRLLADALSDDQRARYYYHLDKLMDAEIALTGQQEHIETSYAPAVEDEPAEPAPEPEDARADEEKIAERVAAGAVTVAPPHQKKVRKPSSMSAHARWARSENFRQLQATRRGIEFVPIPFEQSKFAEPGYVEKKNATPRLIVDVPAQFGPRPPEEIETDDEPIQIGGVDLRP